MVLQQQPSFTSVARRRALRHQLQLVVQRPEDLLQLLQLLRRHRSEADLSESSPPPVKYNTDNSRDATGSVSSSLASTII
ncbi:hypothetical protein F2P81_003067 [Scophthalmus maximus]|uniref:Uncharacterized protein n=1 Tax=Scophthalmus maximus TaxID=52904 RepID=A0A6A4TGF5_SCOMX|nr:hypothetical protein F2P81_003067 [Scophthalmus maximus]